MIHPMDSTSSPAKPSLPIKLRGFALSGHSHRVEPFMSLLGLPFEKIDVDLAGAHALVNVVEHELAGRQAFLAAEHPTIADVAMYSYTAHAPEGALSLADQPKVRARLARVEALPSFIPMKASPLFSEPAKLRSSASRS